MDGQGQALSSSGCLRRLYLLSGAANSIPDESIQIQIETVGELSKIGRVKVHLSRAIEGEIKTCTIKREADGCYVILAVEESKKEIALAPKESVGVDVGIESFATLSDDEAAPIENPQYFRRAEDDLKKAGRRVSRGDRHLQSGRSWSNGNQSESIVYVTRMLALRPSEPDDACDAHLSLLAMRAGDTPRSEWRETDRTKGAGSPFGEQAKCRLRRTENLPGDRPGIPRHSAIALGGGRMSSLEEFDD